MTKISSIVLTHNDEERIVDCLEALQFCDEIVVIDDNSIDRTVELAQKFTKKIHKRSLENNFANQRNYALNFAVFEWVLFIDSDELVSENLKKEILDAVKTKEFSGYYIKRYDLMWGQKILHGEVGQVNLLRLAKKGSGKWHGKVHEKWQIKGNTRNLDSYLMHKPHQNIKEFLREIDAYSTLRSKELYENKSKTNLVSIVTYPLAKFLQNYLLRQGYKDGVAGFIYAVIMSFHSFLVRGKLYLMLKSK